MIEDLAMPPSSGDLMLSHVGGKQRIPDAAGPLARLGLRVSAILDFDALNDERLLRRLMMAVGGDYDTELQNAWRRVDGAARSMAPAVEVSTVRAGIDRALAENDGSRITRQVARKIKALLGTTSGWAQLKYQGLQKLKGDEHQAAKLMIRRLHEVGIFVIPDGDLESWFRGVAGKSSAFVAEVHERGLHLDQRESRGLREFLRKVVEYTARED